MDDQPPPRKKSRFFSGDRSTTESSRPILAAALASQADQRRRPAPLNLHPPQLPSTIITPASPLQSRSASSPFRNHSLGSPSLPPWHERAPGQGLHLNVPGQPTPNSISPTANAFKDLSVTTTKDRRKGVYGAQDLLSQNTQPFGRSQNGGLTSGSQFEAGIPQYGSGYSQNIQTFQHPQISLHTAQNGQFTFTPVQDQLSPELVSYFINPDGTIDQLRIEEFRRLYPQPNLQNSSAAAKTQLVSSNYVQPAILHHDSGPLGTPIFRPTTPPQPISNHPLSRQPFLRRPRQTVDRDRDPSGRLHQPIPNLPNTGVTNLPLHATLTPRKDKKRLSAPPTYFTSPNRIQKALTSALAARKRKRPGLSLPPAAHIYRRTDNPRFNIFHGILLYPELCFHLAAHLPLESLISLYAISRDFHTIIDTRFTTVILSHSLRRAPESSRVFPFRCYSHLCRTDPAARIPHPDPTKAAQNVARKVPSFRWLRMVLWREKVVHEIMTLMAEDGVPLPRRCGLALKKMWFMLDIPDSARRIGYIHNRQLVSDVDLYFIVCVVVKMDMRFNDPIAPEKRDGVRRLLLAQRSLSTWGGVLKREVWGCKLEVLREWMKWKYEPREEEVVRGEPVFGVPVGELGRLKLEYWGEREMERFKRVDGNGNRVLLMRPDQLVQREVVRRRLRCTRHYLRCLLYGYVDPRTLEDFEPRKVSRRIGEWKGEEYEVDGEVGAVSKIEVEDGGDELLDLGPKKVVSQYCVRPEGVGKEERSMRVEMDGLVEGMIRMNTWARQGEDGDRDMDSEW